jgi:cation transport ATPase
LKISPKESADEVSRLTSQGKTVVYVSTNNQLHGLIAMADLIRDESREAVKELKEEGLEVAMLTGDNKQTAAYVAKELGLSARANCPSGNIAQPSRSGSNPFPAAFGKRLAHRGFEDSQNY